MMSVFPVLHITQITYSEQTNNSHPHSSTHCGIVAYSHKHQSQRGHSLTNLLFINNESSPGAQTRSQVHSSSPSQLKSSPVIRLGGRRCIRGGGLVSLTTHTCRGRVLLPLQSHPGISHTPNIATPVSVIALGVD